MIIMDNLFLELVSACLFRFQHLDTFAECLTCSCFECCNNFLCHGVICLLYFSVKCMFLKDRIIFHSFHPVRSVLPVFCGNVSRHSGKTAFLMFGAFQDYLLPVSFCLLCHFLTLLVIQNVTFFLCFLKSCC